MSDPIQEDRDNEAGAVEASNEDDVGRRGFLSITTTAAMAGGLVAGYGTFGVMAARFLYAPDQPLAWQYLAAVDDLKAGDSLTYSAPDGSKVVVARQGAGTSADDFIALSSVCPHLGCAVHWEPQNDRFFCPCHNGVFDPQGKATEGPPAKAKQRLLEFPLKVEAGLLYIQVPLESLSDAGLPNSGDQVAESTGDSHGSKIAPCDTEVSQQGGLA